MATSTQVRSKFVQIGLYSAAIIAVLALLALLIPFLLPAPKPAQPVAVHPAPVPVPVPGPSQLERIRAALTEEIKAGSITVDPFGSWIAIRIGNLITFASGQATALPGFVPVARRIAGVIDGEKGPVRIVGHTDDQAVAVGGPFRDNQALSVARAEAVAALIRPALREGGRLAVDGRGSAEAIADNTSIEGRARNRRVEILITREP
jgi:flagellar motor protein MotB